MIEGKEELWLTCTCSSADHCMRFVRFSELREDPPGLYLEVHLEPRLGWWQRIVPALKYLFGVDPCRYGHFTEFEFDPESAHKMRDICDKYIEEYSQNGGHSCVNQ